MTPSSLRTRIASTLLVALVAGCFGGGARPQFFALSGASGPAAGPPLASLPELGLVIGPIEFPRYLDRQEIVTRDDANRLVIADAHLWGGSLRDDILRVIGDDLGRLLGTARVATYPTEPRFVASYRILLDLREFERVPGQTVRLRVRWTIAAASDGRALVVEDSQLEQPISSTAMEDVVAAESAALGALIRQIAERVLALASS